ncbi:MAG TPA: hypothetical protein VKE93_01510 [Candidatus Angelobacter sp.]|nr:hypothetical protein [Candidatus Angelobacter sp.]
MQSLSFSKLITLVLAILLAGSAFATGNRKGNFQVFDPVQVNGKQLPAGEYTVTWDGEGPNVSLNIVRDGKVVATATGKIVALEQKTDRNATELKAGSTGVNNITGILFAGKKYKLELSGDSGQVAEKAGDSVK